MFLTKKPLLIALTLTVVASNAALAQQCNLIGAPTLGLRTPLVNGQPAAPPFVPAAEGQPPSVGDGPTGAPVVPGHGGPPTLLPWVPTVPSNQIDQSNSGFPIPFSPAIQTPPGVLGPALHPFVPAPPSTPGADPGSLTAPRGSFNPSQELNIHPDGGIPGRGGYCTTIPTVRRGGQETRQYGYRGRNSALGGLPDDGSMDQVELLGPMAGYGVPFGVASGNGMRNSSIDMGGGQRFNLGGQTISTASTIQDHGVSATRYNGIGPLTARQSTEFGQGMRRLPLYSHKSTDFGFPYSQFNPANVTGEKRDHMLLPTAVITNF